MTLSWDGIEIAWNLWTLPKYFDSKLYALVISYLPISDVFAIRGPVSKSTKSSNLYKFMFFVPSFLIKCSSCWSLYLR